MHDDVVIEITEHIRLSKNRIAVIVTGEPLAGKKIVCQRAAGFANLVPYLHLSDATAGFLQLARTIATWFRYVDNDAIRNLADDVLQHLRKDHFSRAHDSCIDLVELSLSNGFRACFLVDRVQFLDEFSLSLLRECLQDRKTGSRQGSKRHLRASIESPSLTGKVCFLCVHVALYNWKSASDVVDDLSRSQSTVSIPTIQLRQAPRDQLRTMFRDMSDMEVEDRWLDAYCEASGHCAGYFIERTAAIRTLSGKLWSQGVPGYAETTEDLVLHIPPGLVRMNRRLPVTQVSAEVAMRFSQVFDELPPLYQTALKIVTIATRNGFYKLPLHVLWEVLNDLIADGVEKNVLQIVTKEIADMFLLEVEIMDGKEILSIRSPAFSDVAFDVCTPIQVHSISESLIERLDNQQNDGFRVSMVKACLHYLIGNDEALQRQCWIEGYENFKSKSKGMAPGEISIWMERIDDEITASGLSSQSVLGKQFDVQTPSKKVVGKILPLLKVSRLISRLWPLIRCSLIHSDGFPYTRRFILLRFRLVQWDTHCRY